jgi:hypothetical protein
LCGQRINQRIKKTWVYNHAAVREPSIKWACLQTLYDLAMLSMIHWKTRTSQPTISGSWENIHLLPINFILHIVPEFAFSKSILSFMISELAFLMKP